MQNNFILYPLGPELPFILKGSTMVTSLTGKGVLLIGGYNSNDEDSNALIELSGDSIQNLKWTILDEKLKRARFSHVSIPISNEVYNNLK